MLFMMMAFVSAHSTYYPGGCTLSQLGDGLHEICPGPFSSNPYYYYQPTPVEGHSSSALPQSGLSRMVLDGYTAVQVEEPKSNGLLPE